MDRLVYDVLRGMDGIAKVEAIKVSTRSDGGMDLPTAVYALSEAIGPDTLDAGGGTRTYSVLLFTEQHEDLDGWETKVREALATLSPITVEVTGDDHDPEVGFYVRGFRAVFQDTHA